MWLLATGELGGDHNIVEEVQMIPSVITTSQERSSRCRHARTDRMRIRGTDDRSPTHQVGPKTVVVTVASVHYAIGSHAPFHFSSKPIAKFERTQEGVLTIGS